MSIITESCPIVKPVDSNEIEKFRLMLGNRPRVFLQHLSDKDGVPPTSRYATDETLLPTVEMLAAKGSKGTYWTINPIANGVTKVPTNADIDSYAYIFIDVDSVDAHREERRATDVELEQTENTAKAVDAILQKCGIDSASILIDSGNGTHLYYHCNIPNNAAARALIKRLLEILAALFGDAIDASVHDPRRLGRVPGTLHGVSKRMCRIVSMPEANESVVSMETLKAVVEELEMRAAAVRVETGDDAEPMEQTASVLPFKVTATSGTSEDARRRAYGKQAIANELEKLANATKRNVQLFKTVAALFELVSGGMATEAEVEAAIEEACTRNGLIDTESRKSSGTYQRARARGLAKPRKMPPPRDQPRQPANVGTDATTETASGGNGDATRSTNDSANENSGGGDKLLTDMGNAKKYAADHGGILRHNFDRKTWQYYTGKVWSDDNVGMAMALAKKSNLKLFNQAHREIERLKNDESDEAKERIAYIKTILAHAIKSQHVQRLKAVVDLARSEPGIPIKQDQLNQHPWLLNVENVTIDLENMRTRPHNKLDYLTKICPVRYDAKAKCPIWDAFMAQTFANQQNMIDYMARLIGYGMTGVVLDHILPIFFGDGSNGKSVFIKTIFAMLGGEYSGKCPRDLLMALKNDKHPASMAWLFGKRFVAAIESDEGARLDEALIKELTGGDEITARGMRENPWTFQPSHKMAMVTNHRPRVTGTDFAMWRRLRLIPFEVTIPLEKQDTSLGRKLLTELPGILNWALRGCKEWQRIGLADPPEVVLATEEYKSNEDRLGEFMKEQCKKPHPELREKAADVYEAYRDWCDARSEKYQNATSFGIAMGKRGIRRDEGKRWYLGIALTDEAKVELQAKQKRHQRQ